MSDSIKIPPHSKEAEESVLGAILLDKDAIIAVADFLHSEHFYSEINGDIYKSILKLYEERSPIDIVTLSDELKKKRVLTKIGGSSYLAELANSVPTAANVEKYGTIIKDLYTKRQLIVAASKISSTAFDEGIEANQALDKAEYEIFSLSQKHLKQSFIPIKDALSESFDRLDELHKNSSGLRGVPTGFKDLDNLLAGLQQSNLIILASRPGIGKTALGLNIARSVAVDHKLPVGIFSVEMSKEELTDRLLVRQSEIDAWKLKTGRLEEDDFSRFSEAMGILADAPLFIDDTPGISILEMRTKARRLQVEHGLSLLIIDYLQLVKGRNLENRVQEVSEISMGTKNLARELKIPILSLSQLSRAVEARGSGSKPRLSDLRESGCLTGETKILRADTGEILTIKELFESQKTIPVLTLSEDLEIKASLMKRVFSSGIKKVFRLIFLSGREIRASANHPFFTVLGWKKLEELKTGDRLAVARNLPSITSAQKIDLNKIILLAHFLGDGCYLKHQPIHYTNGNPDNLLAVEEAARKAFGLTARKIKQENWYHLYFSGNRQQKIANPIIKWFNSLGIYNQRSSEKIIPSFVFSLPLKHLAVFIKHLWATDGNFSFANDDCAIYYASTSKDLILQLQHLLLRFGIISLIRRTKKTGYKDGFIVDISGKTEQLKFLKKIGVYGKEKQTIDAIGRLERVIANPNLDVIPQEIWQLIEGERKKLNLTTREFHRKLNWAYSGTQRHNNGVSRVRLEHINSVLKNVFLKKLCFSGIYWDEIVSIKEEGEEEVYDATVEGNHNFLANDIVVHNSIEQDADVVMFLYREDEDVLENITLEIAKHRNGPTGVMHLRFVPSRVSFYPMDIRRTEG